MHPRDQANTPALSTLSSFCDRWGAATKSTATSGHGEGQPAWQAVAVTRTCPWVKKISPHREGCSHLSAHGAGCSRQPDRQGRVTATCPLTLITLPSRGPRKCLPAGTFIWEAQKNESRGAARRTCPEAGGPEGGEGIVGAPGRMGFEFQLRPHTPESEEMRSAAFRWTVYVGTFPGTS